MNTHMEAYYQKRSDIYNHVRNASTYEKIAYSFLMACFTGIAAQIVIPLSWTPVPITLQSFAVMTAGIVLGRKYGVLSMILYCLLGLVIPWYSGMTGGLSVLMGATGGYFLGFIICAYFVGSISDKFPKSRKFIGMTGTLLIANFAAIYIPGLATLYLTMSSQGVSLSLSQLLMMGLVPFIFGDILKVLASSTFSKLVMPKEE
ncbi:biotin transporter BioY [Methanobrevibacter sp.]